MEDTPGKDRDFEIDRATSVIVTEVTNVINFALREHDLTKADLAANMGESPSRVSQILSGGENLTARTLAAVSIGLKGRFSIEFTADAQDGSKNQRT